MLFGVLFAATLLAACVVPGRHGEPTVIAPPLPSLVVLDQDPYYYNGGYYYWYNNDAWYWSRSRTSRDWQPLPRDRYPNEFRYRGRHWHRDRGWDRDDRRERSWGGDRDRDHDRDRDGGWDRR